MDNSSRLAALKNRVRQGQGTCLAEALANAAKNNSQTPSTSIPQINAPSIGSSPPSSIDNSPKSPIIYSQIPSQPVESGPPIISSGSVAGSPPPVLESSHFKKTSQQIFDAIKRNRANKITAVVNESASAISSNVPEQQSNTDLAPPLVTHQPVNTSVTTNTDTSFVSDSDIDTEMNNMIDLSTPLPSKHNKPPPVQSPNTLLGVKRPLSAVSPNTLYHASDSIVSSSSSSTSQEEPPQKRQKVSESHNVPTLTVTPKTPAVRPVDTSNNSNNYSSTFTNAFSAKRKEAAEQPITNNVTANATNHLRPERPQESRPEPRSDNSAMSEEEGNQQSNQEDKPKKPKKQRIIPGPAGALPQLMTEDGKPATLPDLATQKPNPEKLLNSPVLIRSPKKDPNTLSVDMKKRLEDEIDFRKGPWLAMLHHLQIPPYTVDQSKLLKCNLRYVLTRGFASKVPELVLFVKSVKSIDEDALVEVKDPTATAEATIHRELLDKLNQQPLQGSVLHVKSISVWSPPPARKVHHLVITAANLITHYPVDVPIPEVSEVDTTTFSLLSSYSLKISDADLEAKSPSKLAPKMADSATTPKRPAIPAAAAPPKSNGTSPFGMMPTAAQPKGPMARGQPLSPAPKAPPKYGPQSPGGPPKYGAPKTPYRPSGPPQQNNPGPGPTKTPYRPAPGPNQIVNDQSQTPVSPTRPSPPYNNSMPTQGTPKQPPRPQVSYNANNQINQTGDNQPNFSQPPQQPYYNNTQYNNNAPPPQPTYNNTPPQPAYNNNNAPRPQQPLRRSPQDFPQQNNNPMPNNAPVANQPSNYPQQASHPNAAVPRFVNNTPQPSAPQPQSYAQPQNNAPYNNTPYNNNNAQYNSPAQPRPYNNVPVNQPPQQPYSATPINTNLPSQTPTSSMPTSGLSHATSNLSGSISNFSRSGNNRFLAGMAANNVWGNPTLNANNTAPQSTSGQILPDTTQRR